MPRHTLERLVVSVLVAAQLVGCSDQSPLTPSGLPNGAHAAATSLAQALPGTYELTLLAGIELVLQAHVFAASGDATGGRVDFQICELRGGPTLQMVPLPSSECASGGSGNWVHFGSIGMGTCPGLGSGYACIDFGTAPSFTTVGFRFRYIGQGSGIANGTSDPKDFVP
jgi:hypothetical protein